MVLYRIALPAINAFFITACLLYLMFSLVNIGEPGLLPKAPGYDVEWVRVPEEIELDLANPKPVEPTEPELPPETVKHKPIVDIAIDNEFQWTEPSIGRGGNVIPQPSDRQLVRALGYPPNYPRIAASRGIEGFVVVGFSVSEKGEVFDAHILEAEPAGVFERSALKAIRKFKYKARMVNGKPVSTNGQRYLFRYELDK